MSDILITHNDTTYLWFCPDAKIAMCEVHPAQRKLFTFEFDHLGSDTFRKAKHVYWCMQCVAEKSYLGLESFQKFLKDHPDIALEI